MKKTLITLLALSSIALGATLTEQDVIAYVYKDSDSFTSWTKSPSTLTLTQEMQDENPTGNLILTGPTFSYTNEWTDGNTGQMKNRDVFSFAITLNLDTLVTGDGLTQLVVYDGSSNDTGLGITSDGKLVGLWNGGANQTATSALTESGVVTITFSFSNDGYTTYLGGEVVHNATGLRGDLGNPITTVKLMEPAIAAMQGITFYTQASYNDASFGASAAAINSVLVPEPTTATLSLLALCGLAARRRRK